MLVACEKAEKPILLPTKPNDLISLVQVNLGEHSDEQVYINFLDSNYIKASVKNSCWDLAIDCAPEADRILINGGKGVFIGVLGYEKFANSVALNKVNWRWDESSGGDSIVLKNWCNPQNRHSRDSVYIIDRGPDVDAAKRYFQFKLSNAGFGSIHLEAADLKGNPIISEYINKDPRKNYVFFDFGSSQTLNFEPLALDWQLCFLKCRWVYYEFNPALIYTVTGIQINSRTIAAVAVDSSMNFETVRKQDLEDLKFSSRRDVIGFDWKVYNFTEGRYHTRNYVNYFIKTKTPPQKLYKLRFTDYYSKQGLKGSPKFEVAEIK